MNFPWPIEHLPAHTSFEAVCDDPHRCRWPLEEGWCGGVAERRKSYCAAHLARAYLPKEADAEQHPESEWSDEADPRHQEDMEAA
jgi:hypothetical protein